MAVEDAQDGAAAVGELVLEWTQALLPRRVYLAAVCARLLGVEDKVADLAARVRAGAEWVAGPKGQAAGLADLLPKVRDLMADVGKLEAATVTLLSARLKRDMAGGGPRRAA